MRAHQASHSQPSTGTARTTPRSSSLLKESQEKPPPQAPRPNEGESATVQHYLAVRDRIHEGPFYTILNDGMKNGLKRRANEPAPTEASLFNPFTDNQTYTSKYLKVRQRIPKLDTRPYVTELFPPELQSLLGNTAAPATGGTNDARPAKKRKTLQIAKTSATTRIENYMQEQGDRLRKREELGDEELEEEVDEEHEEEQDEEKPDAVEEDDAWSAVSSDSEESNDDYNAERYFENGDDDDIDDGDPYENTYE